MKKFTCTPVFLAALAILWGCRCPFLSADEIYFYDGDGRCVSCGVQKFVPRRRTGVDCSSSFSPRGERILRAGGKTLRAAPGDHLFPLDADENPILLLSERDSAFARLEKWDVSSGKTDVFFACDREVSGTVAVGGKIYAVAFSDHEIQYRFFDEKLEKTYRKILRATGARAMTFFDKSPHARRWTAELLFTGRPSRWIECDAETESFRFLSPETETAAPSYEVSVVRYSASDGEKISGVLTVPSKAGSPLPLIVFPHGGPGLCSPVYFDARVDFLARRGFAVFQANYRGSSGYGKRFRQAGWKAPGILRGVDDIADGTRFLLASGRFDPEKVFVLGGSWGGFCVFSLMTRHPALYKKGVALFGVYDLLRMLKDPAPRMRPFAALDRLQYGDAGNAKDAAALDAASPLYAIGALQNPVLIVHFKDDDVISFNQAVALCEAARRAGKSRLLTFISGDGGHGFADDEAEKKAFGEIAAFFKR